MSTILEALTKASREQSGRHVPKRLIAGDSPYLPREIGTDRSRTREALTHRWFWIGFGAAAGATIVVALALTALRPSRSPSETPLEQAANSSAAPNGPAAASAKTPDETSPAGAQAGAIVIPPNLEEPDEGLPHPFSDPAPEGTPVALRRTPSPTVVLPRETPVVVTDPPKLLHSAAPAEKPDRDAPHSASEAAAKPPGPQFQLGGIIWDDANPMAMVNRSCVRQGDRVGEAEVVTISPTSVVLNLHGKTIELKN